MRLFHNLTTHSNHVSILTIQFYATAPDSTAFTTHSRIHVSHKHYLDQHTLAFGHIPSPLFHSCGMNM